MAEDILREIESELSEEEQQLLLELDKLRRKRQSFELTVSKLPEDIRSLLDKASKKKKALDTLESEIRKQREEIVKATQILMEAMVPYTNEQERELILQRAGLMSVGKKKSAAKGEGAGKKEEIAPKLVEYINAHPEITKKSVLVKNFAEEAGFNIGAVYRNLKDLEAAGTVRKFD